MIMHIHDKSLAIQGLSTSCNCFDRNNVAITRSNCMRRFFQIQYIFYHESILYVQNYRQISRIYHVINTYLFSLYSCNLIISESNTVEIFVGRR